MNFNLDDSPIAYVISPAISALLIPFLYARKASTLKKVLLLSIGIIIPSTIIPIYLDNGQIKSIIQLILQGNFYLGLMLIGYILSWVLLFKEEAKYFSLSFYIFIASYVLFWVGFITKFSLDSPVVYGPEAEPLVRNSSLVGLFLYILLPMINMILYGFLVSPKKEAHIDLSEKETYQIKAVCSNLAKGIVIAILLGSVIFFFSTFDSIDKNNFLLTLSLLFLIFVALWKMLYSVLIYGIDFDFKNRQIIFHKTFSRSVIKAEDIKNWGIREYNSDYVFAPAGAMAFVEMELTNGKKTSYPLVSWEYGKTEVPKFRSAFEKVMSIPSTPLQPSGFAFQDKNWWWFFTI